MLENLNWFQLTPIPVNAIDGYYSYPLVALSYIIAVLASYVALDLVGRLRAEEYTRAKIYWLIGGAFTMGAGIWSMHFIGMLSFKLPMPMSYDVFWTILSLLAAILASGVALYILRGKSFSIFELALGGVLIGLGIATMHYMGMEGMKNHVSIHYLPGLFFLSILIAIAASEAALWLALQTNQVSGRLQFQLKIISALVMGVAICGMHYTAMAAAIFTPLSNTMHMSHETISPDLLAFFVAGITALIISLALTVSTYYKQMIDAVQNEKEFLNAMLNNLEDGIIACDELGKITVFNDALQKNANFLKKSQKITDLARYFKLYEPSSDQPLTDENHPLWQTLQGECIHGRELIMRFNNNISYDVVVDGQAIINANGKKLGAVIVIHNVTELKKTEKLKNEFVSIVSHELRTPITSIRGSLGLMRGGTVGEFSDKAKKLIEIANNNCDRLLLLINDILDIEKIEAGKMTFQFKFIDIESLVNEAITANKMYGDKFDVEIKLTDSTPNLIVNVDPDRLMQVLTNLISNAVKFSPHKGKVNVKIIKKGNYARVSVSDNGHGISKEFQSRIFQKFSQADTTNTRGKSGTGLGLNISKAIVEKLGGELKFKSIPNETTTFYFDLPIANYINPDKTLTQKNNHRLLICEDDEDQNKYIAALLESEGFEVDMAFSVESAKKYLLKNSYNALLLDLILPDQDGISFIKELRSNEKTRTLPIIVLSVIAETGRAMLNGGVFTVLDWIDKPIDFNKLLNSIKSIRLYEENELPTILHVEDDIDTQNVIAASLEEQAHVISVNSIKKAKDILLKKSINLVVLDLLLPDGNGIDLIPLIAERHIPLIVLSCIELNDQYAKYVNESLIKSGTSNVNLLNSIKHILNIAQGYSNES